MDSQAFFMFIAYGILFLASSSLQCEAKKDRLDRLNNVIRKQQILLEKQEQAMKTCSAIQKQFENEQKKWKTLENELHILRDKFEMESAERLRERLEWEKEKKDLISLVKNINTSYSYRKHGDVPAKTDHASSKYNDELLQNVDEDRKMHDVAARSDDPDPLAPALAQTEQRLTEVSAEVQVLKNQISHYNQFWQESRGSVFTRWGRSVCPNDTELVYSGVVGGSQSGNTGAAADYLCLTLTPVLNEPVPHADYAFLVGAEYQVGSGDAHSNHDPLCAVCRTSRASTMMLPATNVCPAGWMLEYSGYLMAGYRAHVAASQYVCVDSAFEDQTGNARNQNAKLLYYTQAHCGTSLPCPPYENGKLVTCAVCSK